MVQMQSVSPPHAAADTRPTRDGALAPSRAWLVPLLGVIFVILLVAGFLLLSNSPDSNQSGLGVIRYYTAHSGQAKASALVTAISIPFGLSFFAFLRECLRRNHAARPFATIALVGAVVFAGAGAVGAGLTFSLADVPNQLTPSAAQALNVLDSDLTVGLLIAGLSTMMLGFGVAFLVGRAFPAWLGWITVAIGIVALAGPLAFGALLATGVWVLIVSGLLYPRLKAG